MPKFKPGDAVKITTADLVNPEKYQRGTVARVLPCGEYAVMFDGLRRPVKFLANELTAA